MFHFTGNSKQILFINNVVRDFTGNDATKENNRVILLRLQQSKVVNMLKMKLQWMKGKMAGGKRVDKNGMANFIFSPPTLPFTSLRRR